MLITKVDTERCYLCYNKHIDLRGWWITPELGEEEARARTDHYGLLVIEKTALAMLLVGVDE